MAEAGKNLPEASVKEQAREQVGKKQIQLRIDEREMGTAYSNAFRMNATPDEVLLDFGYNTVMQQGQQPVITFKVSERLFLNYYTAKRLAIQLGQLIRRHEDEFGMLEVNAAKRRKPAGKKKAEADKS